MNKKVIKFLFVLFISFIFMKDAHAYGCDEIDNMISNYYSYSDKIEKIDCKSPKSEEEAVLCEENTMLKNSIAAELMKINDNGDLCPKNKSSALAIIKENEGKCSKIFDDSLTNFISKVMMFFYIAGPILLVIFGTLDYTKVVINSDTQAAMKRANKRFKRRLIATILLFLTPLIVNFILSFNQSGYYLSGNSYACEFNITNYTKDWDIQYVPDEKKTKKSSGSKSTVIEGGVTTDKEAKKLSEDLTNMLNTKIHQGNGLYQSGPFPEYWSSPYNQLQAFQCTWWANGRASQYLAKNGTKYKKYPTQYGHGGEYYDVNKKNKYFKYGSTPKPNSIISWKSGSYGHVAYVEGVTDKYIYISHAGSGLSWRGVEKFELKGNILGWSGYSLNGYIYLDEPYK